MALRERKTRFWANCRLLGSYHRSRDPGTAFWQVWAGPLVSMVYLGNHGSDCLPRRLTLALGVRARAGSLDEPNPSEMKAESSQYFASSKTCDA